jgi:SAM-dependent methyltransferase
MKKNNWKAYNDLAWVDLILSLPDDYIKETELYCTAMMDQAKNKIQTLLHLGCGAGMYDYTFKKFFTVTGVDISQGMLDVAKSLNPDITYLRGDMRTIKLSEMYDAIAIPDSIGYMVTFEDLEQTILTAHHHLNPGGILLIVAQMREEFNENNFVYTGVKDELNITIFENNHIIDSQKEKYEAVLIYLIRNKGKLKIYRDRHLIGLFPLATWMTLLKKVGFEVTQKKLTDLYDRFILESGEYIQTMFVCNKLFK